MKLDTATLKEGDRLFIGPADLPELVNVDHIDIEGNVFVLCMDGVIRRLVGPEECP